MKGFRDFLFKGNLIQLAVAFIMGAAFNGAVEAFAKILTDILGKIVNVPDFSNTAVAGINIGGFIAALINLILIGAILYFLLIKPFEVMQERAKALSAEGEEENEASTTEALLVEIRDLLKGK